MVVITNSPSSPRGRGSAVRIDDFRYEMVLPDMQAVLGLDAFDGHSGSEDLGQSVDIDGLDVELFFDFPADRFAPGLRAQDADPQGEFADIDCLSSAAASARYRL
jgi:hypothetical protein